ncbi:MAG: VOC family protein [Alphaproteobacteria bacterium]|nr:VOC family protein [Alphaproteobacteria bacterium]
MHVPFFVTSLDGAPPRGGWAKFVPELLVSELASSLAFWRDLLGFAIAYQRPENHFVYLEHADGMQVMLCQRDGAWETGPLRRPFGRGVMFKLYVDRIDPVLSVLARANWPLHAAPREKWRRCGDRMGGQREFFVQDPDGYLLMIAELIGEKPL